METPASIEKVLQGDLSKLVKKLSANSAITAEDLSDFVLKRNHLARNFWREVEVEVASRKEEATILEGLYADAQAFRALRVELKKYFLENGQRVGVDQALLDRLAGKTKGLHVATFTDGRITAVPTAWS